MNTTTGSTFCDDIHHERKAIPPYTNRVFNDAGKPKKNHSPSASTNGVKMVSMVTVLQEAILMDNLDKFYGNKSVKKALKTRHHLIDVLRVKDDATFIYNEAGVTWVTLYHLVQLVINLMNQATGPSHPWVIQTMLQRSVRYTTRDMNNFSHPRTTQAVVGPAVDRNATPDIVFAFGNLFLPSGSIFDQEVSMHELSNYRTFAFLELKDTHIDYDEIQALLNDPNNKGFRVGSSTYKNAKQWHFYSVSTRQPWACGFDGKTLAIAYFSKMVIQDTVEDQWNVGVGDECQLYATRDPNKIYKYFHAYIVTALYAMIAQRRPSRGVKRARA